MQAEPGQERDLDLGVGVLGEQLGFEEWNAVDAPGGVGEFVDQLSLDGVECAELARLVLARSTGSTGAGGIELELLLPFVHLGDWITWPGMSLSRGPAWFVEGEIERAGGSL